MAVAYTQKPIFVGVVRSDTSAHMRADLDAAVRAAGWIVLSTVTNGIVYQAKSPQGLSVKVTIQDRGTGGLSGPYIVVQCSTYPSGGVIGFAHNLLYGAGGPNYQVIAGICQLFVSVPGNVKPGLFDNSSMVALGVPCLPSSQQSICTALGTPSHLITEIWWSCGDGSHEEFQCQNFRTGMNCFAAWSFCKNGALVIPVDNNNTNTGQGMLCLFPFTRTDNIDGVVVWNPQPVLLHSFALSQTPIYTDALLGYAFQIQGQLWDAFIASGDTLTLDEDGNYNDVDISSTPIIVPARCWCAGGQNETFWGNLLVMTGLAVPVGGTGTYNYAH